MCISSWVSHALGQNNKNQQLAISASLLARYWLAREQHRQFLSCIVTGNDKWCLYVNIMSSIIRKTLKGRKQTKMERGQSGTYLRQTRASSGPKVIVAKTYRDETKRKWILRPNHSGRLLYSTAEEGHCDLAEIFIFVSFHLCVSWWHSPADWTTLSSVLDKCRSVPFPFLFVSCLSRFSLLYYIKLLRD